jgi:hypothetical protein
MQNFELKDIKLDIAADYIRRSLKTRETEEEIKMKLIQKIEEGKQPWGDNLNAFKKAYESGEKICNLIDNFEVKELKIGDYLGVEGYIRANYNRKDANYGIQGYAIQNNNYHDYLPEKNIKRRGFVTKHPYFFVYCNNPPPKKITGLLNGMNASKVLPPSSMFGSMLGQRPKSPLFGIGGRKKTRRGRKHRRRSTRKKN